MKVLVTGASGYIGSSLCGYLLKEGHTVYAIDNFEYGSVDAWSVRSGFKFRI